MTFGEKLRYWIEANYASIAKFCSAFGYKYSRIHNYTKGIREPDNEFLNHIRTLGCDIEWLLTNDAEIPEDINNTTPGKNDRIIRKTFLVEHNIGAGAVEVDGTFQPYYWEWTFDKDNQHVFVVDHRIGNSMSPFINPGDSVIIHFSDQVQDLDIAAVKYYDSERKKRVTIKLVHHIEDDFVILGGTNNAETPLVIAKKNLISIYKVTDIHKPKKNGK